MKNFLVINVCKEKFNSYEFVKPIEDILKNNKIKYFVRHYKKLKEGDLKKASSVIICGTSLIDDEFVNDINYFLWLNEFSKPVFGICAGMQIIGLVFGGKIKKRLEIGHYKEKFKKDFFGLIKDVGVYHLHKNYVDFSQLDFEIFNKGDIAQAVKHKKKFIYGCLFHPEVRNKEVVVRFCEL